MTASTSAPPPLALQPWFLVLLAAYAVLELSFNHRLLQLAGNAMTEDTVQQLRRMELWARVVSGLGLALLLMRLVRWPRCSRLCLALGCTALGLLVMWPLQKALVDEIVARATPQDMLMSVQSHLSTGEALKGRMELRGQPVLPGPVPTELRPVMRALWSSSVLGLSPEDLEATSGVGQLSGWMGAMPTMAQMQDADRKAVMTPVALGASLWFGMLNLCQLFAGLAGWCLLRVGTWPARLQVHRSLLPVSLLLCSALSWWPGNVWSESPGFSQVARPALWQNKPFLAPFVDWSLRAEPAWSDPVAWIHHTFLRGYEFQDPWPLSPQEQP